MRCRPLGWNGFRSSGCESARRTSAARTSAAHAGCRLGELTERVPEVAGSRCRSRRRRWHLAAGRRAPGRWCTSAICRKPLRRDGQTSGGAAVSSSTDAGGVRRGRAGERPQRTVGVIAAGAEHRRPGAVGVEDWEPTWVGADRLPQPVVQGRLRVLGERTQQLPLVAGRVAVVVSRSATTSALMWRRTSGAVSSQARSVR